MATKTTVPTVPLSKVAAELAEKTGMTKKDATGALDEFIGLVVKHLKKGNKVRVTGLGIFQVRNASGAHGPQPGHRRSDQDQGVEEGCLPRRQGSQGSNLSRFRLKIGRAPVRAGSALLFACSSAPIMAADADLVAVGIAEVGAIVIGMIVRPRTRRSLVAAAAGKRAGVAGIDGRPGGREQRDHLAVSRRRRHRRHPAGRSGRAAVPPPSASSPPTGGRARRTSAGSRAHPSRPSRRRRRGRSRSRRHAHAKSSRNSCRFRLALVG